MQHSTTRPKLNKFELRVLELIDVLKQDAYVVDMADCFDADVVEAGKKLTWWNMSPIAKIYNALERFNDLGWIDSEVRPGGPARGLRDRKQPEKGYRPRRLFWLTDEGKKALTEYLAENK